MKSGKFKEGEKVILKREGYASEEVEGSIIPLPAPMRSDWWFIPKRGRIMDGCPVNEDEIRKIGG